MAREERNTLKVKPKPVKNVAENKSVVGNGHKNTIKNSKYNNKVNKKFEEEYVLKHSTLTQGLLREPVAVFPGKEIKVQAEQPKEKPGLNVDQVYTFCFRKSTLTKVRSDSKIYRRKTEAILKVKEFYRERRPTQPVNRMEICLSNKARFTDLKQASDVPLIKVTPPLIEPAPINHEEKPSQTITENELKVSNHAAASKQPLIMHKPIDKNDNSSNIIFGTFSDKETPSSNQTMNDSNFESFLQPINCTIDSEGNMYKSFANNITFKESSMSFIQANNLSQTNITTAEVLNDLDVSDTAFKKNKDGGQIVIHGEYEENDLISELNQLRITNPSLFMKKLSEIREEEGSLKESNTDNSIQNEGLEKKETKQEDNVEIYVEAQSISESPKLTEYTTEIDIEIDEKVIYEEIRYRVHSSRRTDFVDALAHFHVNQDDNNF